MSRARRRIAALSVLAATATVGGASLAASDDGLNASAVRQQGLAEAAAWRDALFAHRAPQAPTPSAHETLVVELEGARAADSPPTERAAASARILADQTAVEARVQALGGTVTARWSIVLNAMAVRVPAGRADAIALLEGVRRVAPVTYLAPAAAGTSGPQPAGAAPPATSPAGRGPAHIALIDTGIDPRAPQLGGGIGPTFPIIGGADLVDADNDPTVGDRAPLWEGHATQMAGLVLRSPELDGLPPHAVPRLLSYRVVAEEDVNGTAVPLARSDRVLSALERAVDPNGDGATDDGADVVLLGVAGSFAGAGDDPVARALAAATKMGAVVVVPAGNDGPTFSRIGSLGGPADSDSVITVGGASETLSARTARLAVQVGPAAANLEPLPLLGPDPQDGAPARVVVLPGAAGAGLGADPSEYAAAQAFGVTVAGSIVVVARGGASLDRIAELAARAGAVGVVVWDREGSGLFPSGTSGGPLPLPVMGVGPTQGRALVDLIAQQGDVRAVAAALPRTPSTPAVASFSSTGPTPDGRLKPDLIAPAVMVEAPWTPAADGSPRSAGLTGTSAAAAQVAAVALRLRVDRPDLGPADVKAALLAAAQPLPGQRWVAQGAGLLAGATIPPVRIAPSGVVAAAAPVPTRVPVTLTDTGADGGRYVVQVAAADGTVQWTGDPVDVPAGGARETVVELPGGADGWTGSVVVTRSGEPAPVTRVTAATFPRPETGGELEQPQVATAGGVTQATVRIGRRVMVGDRIRSSPLHTVRVSLVPMDGSEPLVVAGVRGAHDWPAGSYRFIISRRLPSGGEVPAGRYRLRVEGRTVDDAPRRADSAPFTLE